MISNIFHLLHPKNIFETYKSTIYLGFDPINSSLAFQWPKID